MLERPSADVLQALKALHGNPHWRAVEGWLRLELVASHRTLAEAVDDRLLRQTQGRAKFITEFFDLTKGS